MRSAVLRGPGGAAGLANAGPARRSARSRQAAAAMQSGRPQASADLRRSPLVPPRQPAQSVVTRTATQVMRIAEQLDCAAAAAAAPSARTGDGGSASEQQAGPAAAARAASEAVQQQQTSSNIVPVAAATAAAAAAMTSAPRAQQQQQQQQQQQLTQQHASSSQQQLSSSQMVWLPDRQLWVASSSGATIASSTNGSSSSSGSTRTPHAPTLLRSSVTPRRRVVRQTDTSSNLGSANAASAHVRLPGTLASDGSSASRSASLSRVFMSSAATAGRKSGAMEDRHVLAALDARGVSVGAAHSAVDAAVPMAGVFDGHAGAATAAYAAQHMPQLLHAALSGQRSCSTEGGPVLCPSPLSPRAALPAAFRVFDRWWSDARCDPAFTQHGWDESGSTAVVGLVSGQTLVVANAGDSMALLSRGGRSQRLTVAHRGDNAAEAERVLEAGGRVVAFRPGAAPRVMGSSAQTRFKGSMLTRSLGDFAFKHPQPLLSSDPHISMEELQPDDAIVLLTSDGVSDVLPDDDLMGVALRGLEQARERTDNGAELAKAAADAVMAAALDGGSTDNITVVSLLLDWGGEFAS